MNDTEINCELQERLIAVLLEAYGNINREAWDRWLIRNAIYEQIEIVGSMKLDQPPALENMRILRLLLTAAMNCAPEDVPEAGGQTHVGMTTMRRNINSMTAVLPSLLPSIWSRELSASAKHHGKGFLEEVQRGHDEFDIGFVDVRSL